MKIFDKVEGWQTKVNFVDENNVVLGYDLTQSCCEHADWFIASRPRNNLPKWASFRDVKRPPVPDLTGWTFDTKYYKSLTGTGCGEDQIAIFKIVNGKKRKFIHIFNSHNGYYSHGFEFTNG